MSLRLRNLVLAGLSLIVVAACTGSAGGMLSSGPPAASQPPSSSPGGDGSEPGTGIGQPVAPPASNEPGSYVPANPTIVVPKPGRLAVHPVGAIALEPRVIGRQVTVKLSWWSGVPPCSVLDSVGDVRAGDHISLTIREGADKLGVACIELAMLKATIVDLGELDPGSYTISAFGEAPPVQIVLH